MTDRELHLSEMKQTFPIPISAPNVHARTLCNNSVALGCALWHLGIPNANRSLAMIAERLLKLASDQTPAEPETGVIFDSPGINGLTCYKIVVGGHWRGEGKLLDADVDEEAIRRLWAQLDDCRRHDEERLNALKPVADAAHHFPAQDLDA